MRIKKGDKLEEIVLPRHDSTPFKLSETEEKRFYSLSIGSLAVLFVI